MASYDPDEILLNKVQVFQILDTINTEYEKNPVRHEKSITMLWLLRQFLSDYSDSELRNMIKLIVKFIDYMRYENAKHSPLLQTLNSFKGEKSTRLMVSEIFG